MYTLHAIFVNVVLAKTPKQICEFIQNVSCDQGNKIPGNYDVTTETSYDEFKISWAEHKTFSFLREWERTNMT